MRNNNLFETHIIPDGCRESLLPLDHPGCAALRLSHVSLAGVSSLISGYEIGRASTLFHAVLFCIDGQATLTIENETKEIREGDVCLLPAGASYNYRVRRGKWHIAWVHLRNRPNWKGVGSKARLEEDRCLIGDIHHSMEAILRESWNIPHARDRIIELHAKLILEYLGACFSVGSVQPTLHSESLARLIGEIDADLAKPWSITDMARRLHVAPGHLHRLVKERFRMAPGAMVLDMRMRRASHLLRHTPIPVYRIAELVGYGDPFAFSTAFKRVSGVSPREFRNSHRDS